MKSLGIVSLLAVVTAVPLLAQAGHHHGCQRCGCPQVKKVCRLVPDVKKTPKVDYYVECEDICIQAPSKRCGVNWVPDCNALCGCRKEVIWQPRCGCVVTRKVLKKKTTIVEKPGFKCVVETVCCSCGCALVDPAATEEAQHYVDNLSEEELNRLAELVAAGSGDATANNATTTLPVQPASAMQPLPALEPSSAKPVTASELLFKP
jgi:hypothetical protein